MFENAPETRRFAVLDTMVGHTGERLTPDVIDAIVAEIVQTMTLGDCAWAFQPEAADHAQH